jgi:hypothetical protein
MFNDRIRFLKTPTKIETMVNAKFFHKKLITTPGSLAI